MVSKLEKKALITGLVVLALIISLQAATIFTDGNISADYYTLNTVYSGNVYWKNITGYPADLTGNNIVQGRNATGWRSKDLDTVYVTAITTNGEYLLGACNQGTCNLLVNESVLNISFLSLNRCGSGEVYVAGTGCVVNTSITPDTNETVRVGILENLQANDLNATTCSDTEVYVWGVGCVVNTSITPDTNETVRVGVLENLQSNDLNSTTCSDTEVYIWDIGCVANNTITPDTNETVRVGVLENLQGNDINTTTCSAGELYVWPDGCIANTTVGTDTTYTGSNGVALDGTDFRIGWSTIEAEYLNKTLCSGGEVYVSGTGCVVNTSITPDTNETARVTILENLQSNDLNTTTCSATELYVWGVGCVANTTITPDTNESSRMNTLLPSACPSGEFMNGTASDGTIQCAAPSGSGDITSVQPADSTLTGGADSGAVTLAFNETYGNATYIHLDLGFGGDVSGAYDAVEVVDTSGLDASNITSGELPDARVSDTLTIDSGGSVDTGALTILKDLVAGDGLAGGADDVFPGADSDVTVSYDYEPMDAGNISGGSLVVDDINTGEGATEVYSMNQDVESTDVVSFGGVQTGEINTTSGNVILDPAGNNVLPGSDYTDYLGADGIAWKQIWAGTQELDVPSGDPSILFQIADTNKFLLAVDDSQGDRFEIYNYGAGDEAFIIDPSGSIILDSISGGAAIQLVSNGQGTFMDTFNTVGSDPMCWDGSGSSYIGDCTATPTIFKTNFESYKGGLDSILSIPVQYFDYTEDYAKYEPRKLGWMIEDVAEAEPLAVKYYENGSGKDVDDRAVIAMLINAVQEMKDENCLELQGKTLAGGGVIDLDYCSSGKTVKSKDTKTVRDEYLGRVREWKRDKEGYFHEFEDDADGGNIIKTTTILTSTTTTTLKHTTTTLHTIDSTTTMGSLGETTRT